MQLDKSVFQQYMYLPLQLRYTFHLIPPTALFNFSTSCKRVREVSRAARFIDSGTRLYSITVDVKITFWNVQVTVAPYVMALII